MSLFQFLYHYLYIVVEVLRSDLFFLVFPMLMAFSAIIGAVAVIRYLVSLRRG